MTDPFIRVTNLKKHFEMGGTTVCALDGVSIDIPEHTFTVVMGYSGSGKSTLLYLLGGLDKLNRNEGQIEINGQRLDLMNENELAFFRRKTVGFIFQSFHLIPSMNAIENVAFPMQLAGISARKREDRSIELLTRVDLKEDRWKHRPSELSGGQQQRVAVARALINDPQLILADEPTGNLDSDTSKKIMKLLYKENQSGRTVLVVTHDPRMLEFATDPDATIFLVDGIKVTKEKYEESRLVKEKGVQENTIEVTNSQFLAASC